MIIDGQLFFKYKAVSDLSNHELEKARYLLSCGTTFSKRGWRFYLIPSEIGLVEDEIMDRLRGY